MSGGRDKSGITRRTILRNIGATALSTAVRPVDPLMASSAMLGVAAPQGGKLHNLALNRAAYQSSSVDDNYTAHLATDGHKETYWESAPGTEAWIEVDLGEPCRFGKITLQWREAFATSFRIEASDELLRPTNWRVLTTQANTAGGLQTIQVPPTTARHVRLLATAFSDTKRGCQLSEFEVLGLRPSTSRPASHGGTGKKSSSFPGTWKLQNAMFVTDGPEKLCQIDYRDEGWIPAVVPGTVLQSYLDLGALPDPYFGDQMSQISEDFFSHHDFWYRSTFIAPAAHAGKRTWLDLDGINWKAEIYLNGTRVGKIDGAFLRGSFDVTSLLRPGRANALAVLIHRVAHPDPGKVKVTHRKLGSQTTNGDLLGYDSPTFLATAGWNWLPVIRGRAIGIWGEVKLRTSGNVTILDPWVSSEVTGHSHADLSVRMELRNHSSTEQTGRLLGTIGAITWDQTVTLAPGETRVVVLDKTSVSGLSIENPRLWWPTGYGEQPLYQLKLAFQQAGKTSDEKAVTFGIRRMEWRVLDNVLTAFVNGTRILLRGGNWGMADALLHCDAAGLDLRVRLHRDANLNMIRNWIGMEGHEAFYDACNRYGLLVWDDFWLANPLDGPEPLDEEMFMTNARDKIRRVRRHPSLALYCGRNEGQPPKLLDDAMQAAVAALDGTRHYIPDSAHGTVTGLGPYSVMDVDWYFANRGKTLHSEQGIVAVPPVESLRAMMPAESLWPISDMWSVHDYQTEKDRKGRSPAYTLRIEERYGKPSGVEDYCRKAQMVNLESAKAMYECLQSNQGSGMLLWMTQAAWPSLICQLYDYYFEMTAAFFGAKSGSEPVHILWDSNSDLVKVANNTPGDLKGLTARARIYDLDSKQIWDQSVDMDVPTESAKDCFPLVRPKTGSPVFFVKLELKRGVENVSTNFYWATEKGGSCRQLNELPQVRLDAKAHLTYSRQGCRATVNVGNSTGTVALAIRLKVQGDKSKARILPVFYSDNYFSLLPGENRTILLDFAKSDLAGDQPNVLAEGWNIQLQKVDFA